MVRAYIKPYAEKFAISEEELLSWGEPHGSKRYREIFHVYFRCPVSGLLMVSAGFTDRWPEACGNPFGLNAMSKKYRFPYHQWHPYLFIPFEA
jgi:hypothetical protein